MTDVERARAIERLNFAQRADFEERAAIMEFDGELSRADAELRALAIVLDVRLESA